MISDKNYNIVLASLSDESLMYDLAKEVNFRIKALGRNSTRDKTLMKLLKSPGLMISASGVSRTKFLSSDPDDFCDKLKL